MTLTKALTNGLLAARISTDLSPAAIDCHVRDLNNRSPAAGDVWLAGYRAECERIAARHAVERASGWRF